MSRIGRKPISIPEGVSLTVSGQTVKAKGPKGELSFEVRKPIAVTVDEDTKSMVVTREGDHREARSLHGMTRAMIANMVRGVSQKFEKRLEIYGTGYGCSLSGGQLHVNCGFMGRGGKNKPQFTLEVPAGVEVEVEVAASRGDTDPAKLVVRGCDRQAVGQFAANVRRLRPPEPYKGKGIRYHDEVVRRKAGKALATGAA